MDLRFSISGFIARPVERVFEAVADPALLSRYFTTGGAKGRLETGATVMWDFHDFPGAFPVEVVEVQPNRRIVLKWEANDGKGPAGYQTTVTFTFERQEQDRSKVTISEEGWREDEAGLKGCLGNCQGWSQVLCAMKAWVEHGINLREGFYK